MDGYVARANIEHLRKLLASEKNEEKRRILAQLLAEEEAKLERADAKAEKKKPA